MEPDISVIVPTVGRSKQLRQCLDSLTRQDYARNRVEIIVVDDGGDEAVEALVGRLGTGKSCLRYLRQERRGPAAARNAGIRLARGGIIAFIDDDCRVDRYWLRRISEAHREHVNAAAVGGLTLTPTDNIYVVCGQFLAEGSIETVVNGKNEVIFFPTCNVSCKRWVFERDLFDESFLLPGGEDLEFFWRLFKKGYRFVRDKNITVIHERQVSLGAFLSQAFCYGRGNFLAKCLHADHPLLKELFSRPGRFWPATAVNTLKILWFCRQMEKRLFRQNRDASAYHRVQAMISFGVHKVFYIFGNIAEYRAQRRLNNPARAVAAKRIWELPRLLIMDITHRCNLRCAVCDIWKTADEKDLGGVYIKRLLRDAKKMRVPEIAFSGGEPLLREDIMDLIRHARHLRLKNVGILTNGIIIREKLDALAPYLEDNTICLIVSLDCLEPQAHNAARGNENAWQKTMAGIDALARLKKDKPSIQFHVITIIMNNNLENLPQLARFVKETGAETLQFQPLLANNLRMAERRTSLFWVAPERLAVLDEVIERLKLLKKEYPAFIRNSSANIDAVKRYYRGTLQAGEVKCMSAEKVMLISNKGTCTTCFQEFGDLTRQRLRQVCAGRRRYEARQMALKCSAPCLLPCFCDD